MATVAGAVLFALLIATAIAQASTMKLFRDGAVVAEFYVPVDTLEIFELSLVTNPDTDNLVVPDAQGMIDGIEVVLNGGSGDSTIEYIDVDTGSLDQVNTEVDYPRYTYQVVGGSAANYSTLLATLQYVSNLTADAFSDPPRNITISAFNSSQVNYVTNTAFITPILDNQQAPVFTDGENIVIFIPENSVGNVATIEANDPDGVSFSLANPSPVFGIDSASGAIFVIDSSVLDYEMEENRMFQLTVVATDEYLVPQRRQSTEATVTIRLNNTNDERPVFVGTPYVFSVVEEAAGAFVGQLQAEDADELGGLFFDFASGSTGLTFSLNRGTGEINVLNALDFEAETSYTFNVIVSDQGGVVSTSVTVNVIDIADNRPVISPAEKLILLNLDAGDNEVSIGTEGTGGPLTVTDDSTLQRGEVSITVLKSGQVSSAWPLCMQHSLAIFMIFLCILSLGPPPCLPLLGPFWGWGWSAD